MVHTLQKYVLNPPIKFALTVGLRLPGYERKEDGQAKGGRLWAMDTSETSSGFLLSMA
jgi:hypothetical protein